MSPGDPRKLSPWIQSSCQQLLQHSQSTSVAPPVWDSLGGLGLQRTPGAHQVLSFLRTLVCQWGLAHPDAL